MGGVGVSTIWWQGFVKKVRFEYGVKIVEVMEREVVMIKEMILHEWDENLTLITNPSLD